jgi:hypothetical protein
MHKNNEAPLTNNPAHEEEFDAIAYFDRVKCSAGPFMGTLFGYGLKQKNFHLTF